MRSTTLVLRMSGVPLVTGIAAIAGIIADFQRHGAAVVLSEMRCNVMHKLKRAGVIEHVGAGALARLSLALAGAKALDQQRHATPSHARRLPVPASS